MSCYHPLKGFKIGLTNSGKDNLLICSYKVDHIEQDLNGKWIRCYDNIVRPGSRAIRSFIEIPCGRCIGCRIDYSKQWADRCLLEMKKYKSNYFITLTYDDEHVPKNNPKILTNSKGESYTAFKAGEFNSLFKRDLQLFFKRLRKKTGQNIRYYCCGEYGDNTFRPHYHCIIFNLELNDLIPNGKNEFNDIYYNSKTIEDCWKLGFSGVAKASWETCAYTARYVMKKLKGGASIEYELVGIEPPFVTMSRKPGIAKDYYDSNKEKIFEYSNIRIGTENGSHSIKPIRYFKKLYEIDEPIKFKELKEKNILSAKENNKLKQLLTSKSYLEMLADEEKNKIDSLKKLKRGGI